MLKQMIEPISDERWLQAQAAERKFHNESFEEGLQHYRRSYALYFLYLGIGYDLKGKNIVEIGPADFPALGYCHNHGPKCLIIEPMPSDILKIFNLPLSTQIAEEAEYEADEVWLLNVLQHVKNPHEIVRRAKEQSKIVKFFEPINYGIDECHPWNLTLDMFKEWFGNTVKYYPPNNSAVNFHTWECAYGVWTK